MKGYKIGFSKITKNNKRCFCYALIELEVPEKYPGAKFYSFCGKNRTNVARVLRINKLNIDLGIDLEIYMEPLVTVSCEQLDSAFSIYDNNFYYRPGEIVYPDRFDDRMFMCSNGIHFFTHRQEAIDYVTNDWVINRMRTCILTKKKKKGADF